MTMTKPKIGLYWCSSCGGCEESVVDLAEDILTVVGAVDIVFWPVALDFKYEDVKNLADGELAAVLINGSVRMDEQEDIARLLRQKATAVLAYGSCAHLGGVTGLGNFYNGRDLLDTAYRNIETVRNPEGVVPQPVSANGSGDLHLPNFYHTVKPLDQVIDVDYYVPGCPPPPALLLNAVTALLEGKLPPKGTVLAEPTALCSTCPRRDSKPEKLHHAEFKRIYEVQVDPEKCFLEQGIICTGPVTRGGCEARCINANIPCRGCFGPLDGVIDQGAKFLSMLATDFAANDVDGIDRIIASIPDPAGLFYRYNLAASQLRGKK